MKYKWVSFLSKVTAICNACSLVMIFASKWVNTLSSYQAIDGTIIILGLLAFFLNIVLQVILFVLRATKKDIPVAAWLRIFNMAALIVQLVYYFLVLGN